MEQLQFCERSSWCPTVILPTAIGPNKRTSFLNAHLPIVGMHLLFEVRAGVEWLEGTAWFSPHNRRTYFHFKYQLGRRLLRE